MSGATPILRVSGLRMTFGEKEVLKGIDFEVPRGEIFGFIGPNGAGKTTTIRILATLQVPTRGNVFIDDWHVVTHPEEVRRRIGYMPDHVGVYPGLTVLEYLEFFAGAFRIGGGRRRDLLRDVIDLTDLGSLLETEVQVLSKGMRQRLCLAQTLIHDPALLILDEPASGLDPRARIEFRALLKELRRLGKTILLSSHILTELSEVCDSVGIIEQGELVAHGNVEALHRQLRGAAPAFEVEFAVPPDGALETILAIPGVEAATLDERVLRFRWTREEPEVHEVFGALCDRRLAFVSVKRHEEDLENLFMKLTRGEVS
ncbi:MAG: ABC transporter ATP-binding protein [Planctomycetota bacterium]|jgi:ABC-2 type transport system ATP-binding protein